MLQKVRITSKRQITIPAEIYRNLSLNEGDDLLVAVQDNKIILQKGHELLQELAGSVQVPEKYHNKDLDFIIKDAKREYFKSRR